jgi:hypothetical protein
MSMYALYPMRRSCSTTGGVDGEGGPSPFQRRRQGRRLAVLESLSEENMTIQRHRRVFKDDNMVLFVVRS